MHRHNAWLPSWHSKEQTEAWKEMPLSGGKNAPFTEQFREQWREWYKKYRKRFPHPALEHAYAEIDRQKAKEISCAR
jgi:ribosomal protein L20A (L18A)